MEHFFDRQTIDNAKSWCFEEARKILKNISSKTPQKGFVLFETGYGPSGLPHIGTFGEVVRTCFVIFAFKQIAPEIPVKLICFSDDYDGMRKIPDNVPNKDILQDYIKKPLTSVPDPFGTHQSYGHHMNARLKAFLDSFGFEYQFISATDYYKSGQFNQTMSTVVQKYDELMEIMMKNLGEERQSTYSPLMPISQISGRVLEQGVKSVNKQNNTVIFTDEDGKDYEISVLDGNCKLQWKIDFGARWCSLGVDYEIFGKDHMPNEKLYQSICKILGGKVPVNFWYELFLGEDGAKISKTKGNGITVDQWLKYAPQQSLALYMFLKPKTAKKLYFDVIPKHVDEYLQYLEAFNKQDKTQAIDNPVYYICSGKAEKINLAGINYSLLLNLACACNPDSESILWGFIEKYNIELKKGSYKILDDMVLRSINYYNDFIKPLKKFKTPSEQESVALNNLIKLISEQKELTTDANAYQNIVYGVGMDAGFEIKDWFKAIYQVLLGQESGPRVGSFIKIFGKENFLALCKDKNIG